MPRDFALLMMLRHSSLDLNGNDDFIAGTSIVISNGSSSDSRGTLSTYLCQSSGDSGVFRVDTPGGEGRDFGMLLLLLNSSSSFSATSLNGKSDPDEKETRLVRLRRTAESRVQPGESEVLPTPSDLRRSMARVPVFGLSPCDLLRSLEGSLISALSLLRYSSRWTRRWRSSFLSGVRGLPSPDRCFELSWVRLFLEEDRVEGLALLSVSAAPFRPRMSFTDTLGFLPGTFGRFNALST